MDLFAYNWIERNVWEEIQFEQSFFYIYLGSLSRLLERFNEDGNVVIVDKEEEEEEKK